MIIVDFYRRPGYEARPVIGHRMTAIETEVLLKDYICPRIPHIFVREAEVLGIDLNTPSKSVRVHNHVFDVSDIHPPNVAIKVDFPGNPASQAQFLRAYYELYDFFSDLFIGQGIIPELVTDLVWGSRHGKGNIDGIEGVDVEW